MAGKRGRPARLSRARVVDAALELLEEGGPAAVTMSRVAEAVSSSPMGLYRHVSGREALLESMLETLIDRLEMDLPEAGEWDDNVRQWMAGVRDHFLAHPQLLSLIDFEAGSHISPAWLRTVGELIAPLERAGLHGPELARGVLWVSRLTLGTLVQEIAAPVADTAAVLGGLGRLEGDDAVRWVDILPELKRVDDDRFFETVQDQAIRALEEWRTA